MTIVLALKVGDGVVLGADSASTLIGNNGSYHNSYFNAEKLFNLVKGLPIGAVTHGLGGLAGRSVAVWRRTCANGCRTRQTLNGISIPTSTRSPKPPTA